MKMEALNVPRGGFFLPWSRRQTTLALICALQGALESLCLCGAILEDPEDSTYCEDCNADQHIHMLGDTK